MSSQLQALISNAAFAAAGLLGFMILTRSVPPDIFGQWVLFVSISTFVDLIRFGITRPAAIRLIASSDSMAMVHLINGASLKLGFYILLIIGAISYSLWAVGRNVFDQAYLTILLWYPLVGVSNLLWNNALTMLHGVGRFAATISLRLMNMVIFLILISVLAYMEMLSIHVLLAVFVFSNAVSSVYSLVRGWDSASYFFVATKEHMREILSFGRYAVGSTMGSSLLKSADSFIISLSPVLGVTGVAIYAIPFKIVEMLELPIRSIAQVGYNALSRAFKNGNHAESRFLMTQYAMLMVLLTVPVIVGVGLFSREILMILGGKQYLDYMPQMLVMLYVLLLYGAMLAPDRLTGVALEAMGRPKKNMYKVAAMAACNVVGDLVAVFVFKSLLGVVIVTVFFVVIGNLVGYRMIPRDVRPVWSDVKIIIRQWKIKYLS